MREAKRLCDVTVVSIFVNPAQFSADEDLDTYPRTVERDLALLRELEVDLVFLPTQEVLYGTTNPDVATSKSGTFVTVRGLSHQLEGAVRPHFFIGVATVVTKLLNIVQPDRLVMGQKDGQQCVVLSNMIRHLCLPIEFVMMPTGREADGLAMSSRNRYLSPPERAAAPAFYRGLQRAEAVVASGNRRAADIINAVRAELATEPLCREQYITLSDRGTLEDVTEELGPEGAMLSGAVLLGETRIIDNVFLA